VLVRSIAEAVPQIRVFLNGGQVLAVTDSFDQTATKHGMRITDAGNAIDSITVAAPDRPTNAPHTLS